ncbi:MAG: signal transduction histidine kinase, LytS [Verrucomicrobia bacterium]|nr:signal transduction histidine kinase, LytS [Verrucomicrobiota bacterium]
MVATSLTNVLLDNEPARERAKERLYVLFQAGGWFLFTGVQLFVIIIFPQKDAKSLFETLVNCSVYVEIGAVGLLITHFTRSIVRRRNWKNLGWRALVPRILGLSTLQAFGWNLVVFGYIYVVLQLPWTSKVPLGTVFVFVWIQGIFLLSVWWCIYFFYHLFDRFNRLQIEQLSLATHAKEAELRALKSQVNPHFIFNSLNSLRALIDEDPSRARQAVTQLANLLRYSLQSGQLETVPFEEELRVVNDYLALEQVRHEERLRLRLDIAPETLQLPIPPMLLQTLVENAVKYGISTRPEGGEIAIIARREHDSLRLQVTNPGAIESPIARAGRAGPASTGLGLANAANRLRLLFGDQATLQLRPGQFGNVVAEAIIPLPISHA